MPDAKKQPPQNEDPAALQARCRELEQKLVGMEKERHALRDSLHEHRLLFRVAGIAIAVVEADGRISLANQAFETLFNQPRGEIENKMDWTAFVAPQDVERLKRIRQHRLNGAPNTPSEYDATLVTRTGDEILGHITIAMVPGTKRSIVSIADITYRQHVETQLAESERNYRTIFEKSPDAIVILGPRGEVQNVNGRLHDWLGYSRDEVIGKHMLTLPYLPWRSKLRVMRKFAQRIMGKSIDPYDLLFIGKDNKPYYGRIRASLIRDEAGRPVADLVMISNISEQKRTEQALQSSEKKLIKAGEIAHLGYWEYDIIHDHIILSPELYRIYDIDSDTVALTYARLRQCAYPDDRPYFDNLTERLKQKGEAEFEYRVEHTNNTIRYLSGKAETSYDHAGNPVRIFGITQDITERRKAEAERLELETNLLEAQKYESLGVLAGGIAHDFNNLLMAMTGNAELIQSNLPPDSPFRKGLADIISASSDAADLCRQMLAYAGHGQFYISPLNITETIEEMAHLLHVSIGKTVVLQSDLNPELPCIEADVSQIQQLVMNLVSNASEAIGDDNGTITLKTGHRHMSRTALRSITIDSDSPEDDYIFLKVSDDGEGIIPEVQHRMFDPFFSTKFTGRGLGLAAVSGIVRSIYGGLDVASTPGKGTTVTVFFPATTAT